MPAAAMPIALREAANKIVHIVNEGDLDFPLTFDGMRHRVNGRRNGRAQVLPVSADRAWHWFGNPSKRTSYKTWSQEVRRIKSMFGYVNDTMIDKRDETGRIIGRVKENPCPFWDYIMDGKIYVKEFGKGANMYSVNFDTESPVIESTVHYGDDIDNFGNMSIDDLDLTDIPELAPLAPPPSKPEPPVAESAPLPPPRRK